MSHGSNEMWKFRVRSGPEPANWKAVAELLISHGTNFTASWSGR
jgi:hypothetical protein